MAGIVTNPMTQIQAMGNQSAAAGAQGQQYSLMSDLLSKYLGGAMNPKNMAAGSASQTQPLSAGAVENIQRSVGGNMAERGLSQAFPMWQKNLATAEASPLMSMSQQGQQNYLQGQQLPFLVPHPGVSMPSPPQTSSTLSSGITGLGMGLGMGAL